MVNVLGQDVPGALAKSCQSIDWSYHDYGKAECKENRKMGHITLLTDDLNKTLSEIEATQIWALPKE